MIATTQTDRIDSSYPSRHTFCNHEGGNILTHGTHATDESAPTDGHEMVNTRFPTNHHSIFQKNMPSKFRTVGKNDSITQDAIVRHMDIGHKKAIVPDRSNSSALLRTRMNGYEFTNRVSIPNHQTTRLTPEFEILRRPPNNRHGVNLVEFSDPSVPGYRNVVSNPSSAADFDVLADHGVFTDFDPFSDSGSGMNKTGF
jgi:hypothetical protein